MFALAAEAARAGWDQAVVCGVPADDPTPEVASIPAASIHTVRFESTRGAADGELPFPVPGMSDVMPYESTVWSSMSDEQLAAYRDVWTARLREVVERERPTIIHAHHGWIVAGLVKDVAPDVPLIIHTHGTALRQRVLCPALAEPVAVACRRADGWVTLHDEHRAAYTEAYGLEPDRVHVVGAGYRDDLFRPDESRREAGAIGYAGKLSDAKGLHPLLDAVAGLASARPDVRLHVAGSGSGPEAEALEARMASMSEHVEWHGRLDQAGLAAMLQRCPVFVLPSYYEGLPLVLVEAVACGCRLVASALPGVIDGLAGRLGEALETVPLPTLESVDRPVASEVPAFAERLQDALARALERGPVDVDTSGFTWAGVFERVAGVWSAALGR